MFLSRDRPAAALDDVERCGLLRAQTEPSLTVSDLYGMHRNDVYRRALRYGSGSAQWAEDVMQEVFLTAMRKLPELHHVEDMGGWFYRVTTNHCLKRLRQDRLRRTAIVRWFLSADEAEVPPADDEFSRKESVARAVSAIGALPPKQRVAFSMYYLDGLTQPQIAEVLGYTKGYVCKLIQRAESRLTAAGWEVKDG